MRPSLFLPSSIPLSDKAFNALKDLWAVQYTGNHASSSTVFGNGSEWSEEQQFYYDMRWAIRELELEEQKVNEARWEEWLHSYTISGLY